MPLVVNDRSYASPEDNVGRPGWVFEMSPGALPHDDTITFVVFGHAVRPKAVAI